LWCVKIGLRKNPYFAIMKPTLFYCYDAYCGWCYGFSNVIKKIETTYNTQLEFEVLSGGMILPEKPVPIATTANYIAKAYKIVEETTGITFGEDYLWHINHPDLSDWFPDSLKPAIALCIFKEYYPEKQIEFASNLQYALHFEGRDLTDDAAYEHLLEKYSIQPEIFYTKLKSEEYKEKAQYEFALCKQLQITGYPCVLIQTAETKFHLVARGYTSFGDLNDRIKNLLNKTSF
jgi:putative protein-disulfide isomerase